MHPHSHLTISWIVGHRLETRRDRALVAWAGVAPDLDGLTAFLGVDTYGRWHHVLTHGIVAVVGTTLLAAMLAHRRRWVAVGAFAAFHVHLLCDLLGSGTAWSLSYLYPLSSWGLHIPYGWELASWQNMLATALALAFSIWAGVRYGHTFVETFLPKAVDYVLVASLKRRFKGQSNTDAVLHSGTGSNPDTTLHNGTGSKQTRVNPR
jgi:inner membrane protein